MIFIRLTAVARYHLREEVVCRSVLNFSLFLNSRY